MNNTSFKNGTQYDMLASIFHSDGTRKDGVILMGDHVHRMRNNIGFPDDNTNMSGVDDTFNTWNLKIDQTNDDFVGTTDTGFMGPRQPDGSLPNIGFVKLREGSPLIDRGTDVGIAFNGKAPDLGAYEFGTSPGSGGVSGSGGVTGSGGDGSSGSNGSGGVNGSGSVTGSAGDPGFGGSDGSGANNHGGRAGVSAGGAGGGSGGSGAIASGGSSSNGSGGGEGTARAGTAGSSRATTDGAVMEVPSGGSNPSGCACTLSASATDGFSGRVLLAIGGVFWLVGVRRRAATPSKSRTRSTSWLEASRRAVRGGTGRRPRR
jgi:hypothetical protein